MARNHFKQHIAHGKIYLLSWSVHSRLFGPDWETMATFDDNPLNRQRCRSIIRMLNDCSTNTNASKHD